MQELLELLATGRRARLLERRRQPRAVYGSLDRAEHADRRRTGRAGGQVGQLEGEARLLALGVVDHERVLAHVRDVVQLEATVRPTGDPALALGAEADRGAVRQADLVQLLLPLGAHGVEGAVVED